MILKMGSRIRWLPPFPDPSCLEGRTHPELPNSIVAVGDDYSVEALLEAYALGIFPWPHEGLPLLWFCPEERGILEFSEVRLSRRLRRICLQSKYRFTVNQRFPQVIAGCAAQRRPNQQGTWINADMVQAYCELHKMGAAHSVECWHNDQLAGGLYGVAVGGVFSAESMFYTLSNASQMALLFLVVSLKEMNLSWLDIQMVTPHLAKMGGKLISRGQFLRLLEASREAMGPSRSQLIFKNPALPTALNISTLL